MRSLDFKKFDYLDTLISALGPEADLHVVGGAVRDTLLNREIKDLDLASPLSPKELWEKLEKSKIKVVPVGIRRGTILAHVGGHSIEITTFRDPLDETKQSFDLLKDLSARDFTINSIAYSIKEDRLVDPYSGIEDLKNKILRTVGDPELRFKQDPHRILRMIRFGPGDGRSVESSVIAAAKKFSTELKSVAAERIYPELVKILTSENPAECLELLNQIGALEVILPEAARCVGFQQNKYHKFDVFQHTCSVIQATPRNKVVRFAALFHDLGKPDSLTVTEDGSRKFIGHEDVSASIAKDRLTALKAPTEDIKAVTVLVQLHMKDVRMSKPKIRKLKAELGDQLENWLFLKRADLLGGGRNIDINVLLKEWDDFIEKLVKINNEEPQVHFLSSLAVSGSDIMEVLDIKPGPLVGQILRSLHEIVLEDPGKNERKTLLELASKFLEKDH